MRDGNASITIDKSNFNDYDATANGGGGVALAAHGNNVHMVVCVNASNFKSNKCALFGEGIACNGLDTVNLTHTTFTANSAQMLDGAIFSQVCRKWSVCHVSIACVLSCHMKAFLGNHSPTSHLLSAPCSSLWLLPMVPVKSFMICDHCRFASITHTLAYMHQNREVEFIS